MEKTVEEVLATRDLYEEEITRTFTTTTDGNGIRNYVKRNIILIDICFVYMD